MNAVYRRERPEPAFRAMFRLFLASAITVALAWAYGAALPWVRYELVVANLGNPRFSDRLLDRVVVEQFPDAAWGDGHSFHPVLPDSGRRGYWVPPSESYFSQGQGSVETRVNHSKSFEQESIPLWWFLDGRLNRVGRIRGGSPFGAFVSRDKSAAFVGVIRTSNRESAVVSLGRKRNAILAVVRTPLARPSPAFQIAPFWTDANHDGIAELEWIRQTGQGALASEIKLEWGAGRKLRPIGEIPDGFVVWLPGPSDDATFTADERIDDVIRRLVPESKP